MDTSRDWAPRLGSGPGRPWVNRVLAVVSLGLGLAALLEFVMPYLPPGVALVGAGWPWLPVGLVLLGASLIFTWRAYRWQPPLIDRVRAEKGLPVQLDLGEPDAAGTIDARLKLFGEIQEPLAAWQVELSSETSRLRQAVGRSEGALAFFDPQSGLPTAVQFEDRFYVIQSDKVSIIPARNAPD